MALDRDIQRWVDALRSGNYQQGRLVLHQGNRFCCLGVCRDVLGAKWVDDKVNGKSRAGVYVSQFGEETVLNLEHLPNAIGTFLFGEPYDDQAEDVQQQLIEFNDNGVPFAEIADWIEIKAEAS